MYIIYHSVEGRMCNDSDEENKNDDFSKKIFD